MSGLAGAAPQSDAPAPARAAPHRTPASRNGWSFWRVAECRSAGFPLADVLGFADTACGAAADRCAQAEAASSRLWAEVRCDLKARIKRLLDDVRLLPAAKRDSSPIQQHITALRAAVKCVERRDLAAPLGAAVADGVLARLRGADEEAGRAAQQYGQAFIAATAQSTQFAMQLARSDRLREAVTWQSPQVARTVLGELARGRGAHDAKLRRNEELVARYAQRYCTKNDTIGFFGPVGWGRFVEGAGALRVDAAAQLLSARSVYFEDWTIHALAARLSAEPRLRPWQTPRRMPYIRLDGGVLHLPGGSHAAVTEEEAAVLAGCSGCLTAREIALALIENPFLGFTCEADVLATMDSLARHQRISMGFVVRVGDPWPERHLRDQIAAIDDPALRQFAGAGLDALEAARRELAAAAGDADAVARAVAAMNAVFEEVTGMEATRHAGQTYGARTVAYEDCRRDMQVEFGQELADALQPPLDLILASARWFCHALAQQFSVALRDIFDETRAAHCDGGVDFPTFWLHAQTLFFGDQPLGVEPIQHALSAKWEAILGLPADAHCVQRDSAALRAAVRAAFEAPHCGWRSACHQSPDVMIAADSVGAIMRGDCLFVLGEVHLGLNTLINHSAVNQSPDPQALLAALRTDRGAPRVIPLLSRAGTRQPIRVQTVTTAGYDVELCFSHDARPLDADTALNIADLVVEQRNGALAARTRDGRRCFDLMDVFGEFLSGYAADKFHVLRAAPYRPRIAIDQLVIQRQAWRFRCDELPFAGQKDAARCFLEARQWRAARQLPRWVFVTLPWEKKPFYLDFDSPLYVRMLAKQIRNALRLGLAPATEFRMSEMLPAHGQSWLPDAAGRRYTSELRIVASHQDDLARPAAAPTRGATC